GILFNPMIFPKKYFSELLKKQKDSIFVIVGEGPEMVNLQNKVRKLGIDKNVIFTGPVSWDVIENFYALGDIFVCASTSETQGLTYIEALSSHKPLLVRWDNCLEGVLKQGENGIGYNNLDEFINGYFEISNNYENMVKNCREVAIKFSDITFAENVLKIYETVKSNYNKN
ncbi:MAG: glycosyltransferase, partial [Lachnospirales bacterium]